MEVETEEGPVQLGSAEIRVVAQDGAAYASPDMIYHYVCDPN